MRKLFFAIALLLAVTDAAEGDEFVVYDSVTVTPVDGWVHTGTGSDLAIPVPYFAYFEKGEHLRLDVYVQPLLGGAERENLTEWVHEALAFLEEWYTQNTEHILEEQRLQDQVLGSGQRVESWRRRFTYPNGTSAETAFFYVLAGDKFLLGWVWQYGGTGTSPATVLEDVAKMISVR